MISSTNHSEMWGVELTDPSISTPTQVILQKYLNANDQDVARAKDQLTKSLAWRAKMKPLELTKAKHSREKFSGLGYVTVYQGVEKSYEGYHKKPTAPESKEIFTWYAGRSRRNVFLASDVHPNHFRFSGTSMAMSPISAAPSAL